MFDVRKFDAQLALKGISRKELARFLGIDESTVYRKIKSGGNFSREEINAIIIFLEIDNPKDIFFAEELA